MSSGLQRDAEKSWFSELSDKGIICNLNCVAIQKGFLQSLKV